MKILKMKVNWNEGIANKPELQVLVDKIPSRDELVYENKGPLYYAEKDGYVEFFQRAMSEPGRGFGGRSFELNMKDGDVVTLVGPWSSRAGVMNGEGFKPCLDVSITESDLSYERGYAFGAGHVTLGLLYSFPDVVDAATPENPKGLFYIVEVHDGGDITYTPSVDPSGVMKPSKLKEYDDMMESSDESEKLSEVQKDVVKPRLETGKIGSMIYAISNDKRTVTITLSEDSKATLAVTGNECRNNDIIVVDAYPKE